MISVIIPTCDRPHEFLREALNSVLEQSLTPAEIIIVDNGIKPVQSGVLPDIVKLYRIPALVGASRARNFGAAMAKGSYLAFLDDDDWWDSEFLSEAWRVLEDEQTECVYGRKDIFDEGAIKPYKCPSKETLSINSLLKHNPGTGGQNLVIKKQLFWRIGGFNEGLITSEDRALAIEIILLNQPISVAPSAIAVLRTHSGARLRESGIRKLRFVWKYRHLYGFYGGSIAIVKILRSFLLNRIKNIFSGIKN